MSTPSSHAAPDIDALYRAEFSRLVAPLIRIVGSFAVAEEVVQDVFMDALQSWAKNSPPDKPVAWLRRATKNRAIDRLRRHKRWQAAEPQLVAELSVAYDSPDETPTVADDLLRLIFTCCHPSLSREAQIGLTLRTVCGFTSEEAARAFLIKRTTLQQRLVRARRKIDQAGVRYAVPEREQLHERLSSVLRTIYLLFNEGYKAGAGEALIRTELCEEAIRLARLLVQLLPEAPAPQSLLALMLLHHSRRSARIDEQGDLVPLDEQDRERWDRAMIEEALPLVDRGLVGRPLSTYAVEAAIAALHCRALTADETDWAQIHALYHVYAQLSPRDALVELNGAVAQAMAGGLDAGLERLRALQERPELASYHLLPAARADLLRRAGRTAEASEAYAAALELVDNDIERRFLERRRDELLTPT